ncbi:MAG: TetR/AcrR family transcriptional regulator [Candidatus Faecousia sp.]|nr:TetR/AcrR family transcriptional regulator [Candidatus Faecousia sp.]
MSKERTEKAIMHAFLELLNQYPLDKITVKDIVTACGISRNTFYYHYQDIYDLLRATFDAVAELVLREDVTTWQESLRSCTRFALENRRAVYHVYRSAHREQLERYLYRVTEERMDRLIRHLTAQMSISEEDVRYLTLFYKCAVVGILLEWLNADMKGDVDRLISRMGVLLEGNLRLSLERVGGETAICARP